MEQLRTLAEILIQRKDSRKGITYINQTDNEIFVSYKELYSKALRILFKFQEAGIKPKQEVVFQFVDTEAFINSFYACVLGNMIPVPVDPANNQDKTDKLLNIWKVLKNPFLLFKDETHLNKIGSYINSSEENTIFEDIKSRSFQYSESELSDQEGEVQTINEDDLCYIQFSSGSTGIPKGVPLTHKNLLSNCLGMARGLKMTTDDSFISWKPLVHDFSMIAFNILPLLLNSDHYRIPTTAFIWRPSIWFHYVNKYRITVLGSPNFGFLHFLKNYKRNSLNENWDLSCIRLLMNGAEPISHKLIDEFTGEMAQYKLKPETMNAVYGMAETTLMVTHGSLQEYPKVHCLDRRYLNLNDQVKFVQADNAYASHFVDCGMIMDMIKIKITGTDGKTLEDGKIGHVLFKGDCAISNYYNNPEATANTIKDGWVDSGDVGFLKDGRFTFTGRFKEIIIKNGVNYYPSDVEASILSEFGSSDINKYIACGVHNNVKQEEELLIFVYDKGKVEEFYETSKKIKQLVLRNMGINVNEVIPVRQIPKTSSGKIRRSKLTQDYLNGEFDEILQKINIDNNPEYGSQKKIKLDDEKTIELLIKQHINNITGKEITDTKLEFVEIGLTSLYVSAFIETLNQTFNINLNVSVVYDYPSIEKLTKLIKSQVVENTPKEEKINEMQNNIIDNDDPIAIIGMGCRLPAGSNSPELFWELLMNGIDGISEVKPERWKKEDYFDADKEKAGKMYTALGGFLDIPIDQFDSQFFNISPKEAKSLDPQQRLLLEVAWEAFEDAGYDPLSMTESNTGVYLGMSGNDYLLAHMHSCDYDKIDPYSLTGTAFSTAAGRLSFFFGLQGPCMSVDTACSSTLISTHLAVQALRNRECDMSLVGGAHLLLSPEGHVGFSKLGAISPDGHSKSFDASANGYARSEGSAVLILKRLSDAVKDNDRVLALIKGSAANQDGKSNGLTAPSGIAQQQVIRKALKNANVSAGSVDYIEAHGTGTPLGDPIEVNAIAEVYGQEHTKENPVYLGSVKSNIGHTEPIAGMAGIIKIIHAFNKNTIAANYNFKSPNPLIEWDKIPIEVVKDHRSWDSGLKKRRAGLNSFGFGGSNAHAILEEPPVTEILKQEGDRPLHILNLSAKNNDALNELASKYLDFFKNEVSDPDYKYSIADICYTASVGRYHFNYRLSICADSSKAFINKLEEYLQNNAPLGVHFNEKGKLSANDITFLFTGQGSQYVEMGKELYHTNKVFKETIDRCDELFYSYLLTSIKDLIYGENASEDLVNRTDFAQPLIFSIEYALAQVWKSYGIEPAAVAGHSIGEFAAAVIAEVMSLEDAVKLVSARGRLMNMAPGNGVMLSISTTEDKVIEAIDEYKDKVSIAAVNTENSIVISGEKSSVELVKQFFISQNIEVKELVVSHAFHSPLMDSVLNEFEKIAATISYKAPEKIYISTLTGKPMFLAPDSKYWRDHLRNTVRFYDAMNTLVTVGQNTFLEIGSAPILTSLGKRILGTGDNSFFYSMRKGKSDVNELLFTISGLYVSGIKFDWHAFDKDYKRYKVSLPKYAFQRSSFWMEPATEKTSKKTVSAPDYHPLIGQKLISPALEDVVIYQREYTASEPYFMEEHIIYDTKISPAAAHTSMLYSIVNELFGESKVRLKNMQFINPLVTLEEGSRIVQFIINTENGKIKIVSRDSQTGNEWSEHCKGNIDLESFGTETEKIFNLEDLKSQFDEEVTHNELYDPLWEIGFHLGDGFRRIMHTWKKGNEGVCLIEPLKDTPNLSMYDIYPGIIDSIFQTLIPVSGIDLEYMREVQNIFIPFELDKITFYKPLPEKFYCHTKGEVHESLMRFDMTVFSESGEVLMEIENMIGKRTDKKTLYKALQINPYNYLYQTEWESQSIPLKSQFNKEDKVLVFADDKFAGTLINQLTEKGQTVVRVNQSDNYENIIADNKDINSIFYLWSCNEKYLNFDNVTQLKEIQEELISPLLKLVQVLIKEELTDKIKLRIITNNSFKPVDKNNTIAQSTIWGAAKCIALENTDMWGGIIDIEGEECIENGSLLAEIGASNEQQVRLLKDKSRLVARFNKTKKLPVAANSIEVQKDATYIVTGGLGNLGLLFANWLIENGAGNIVLTGRSELSEDKKLKIDELHQNNEVKIEYLRCDVADYDSVSVMLEKVRSSFPQIKGIIHSAGLLEDSMITNQSWEKFDKVFSSKVYGAWNLHRATINDKLDMFVLFSSISASIGNMGQSNYAAANEFLNSIATYRKNLNLPSLSINWGPWAEIGMAADQDNRGKKLESQGIQSISPMDGIKIFENLLNLDCTQPVVASLDWNNYSRNINSIQYEQLYLNNVKDLVVMKDNTSDIAKNAIVEELKEADSDDRYELLLEFNKKLAAKVAGFENHDQIDVDAPVNEQGFDSIMSVEVKDKLSQAFSISLPAALFFNYPTISAITKYMLDEHLKYEDVSEEDTGDESADSVLDELNALIDNN